MKLSDIVKNFFKKEEKKFDWIEEIQSIGKYMDKNSSFRITDDTDRHRIFTKDGDDYAFIWFKWALGGWRIKIYGEPDNAFVERGPIKDVAHLKEVLGIN